jgi:hypothetical protein
MATIFQKEDIERLSALSLGDDLVKITYKFGRDALTSAVRALCSLAHHNSAEEDSPFRSKLLKLAQTFYQYLTKHYNEEDIASKSVRSTILCAFPFSRSGDLICFALFLIFVR